jgi:hypothetical protein
MSLSETVHRIQSLVASAGRLHPQLWRSVDATREKGDWPSWCFLPIDALAHSILSPLSNLQPPLNPSLHAISALSAWRATQGIYRFDPSIFTVLCDTPLEGPIPTVLLRRLPEWCPYILTPGLYYGGVAVRGFFSHLDWTPGPPHSRLHLLIDLEDGTLLSSLPMDLSCARLDESLEASRKCLLQSLAALPDSGHANTVASFDVRNYTAMIAPFLNLLLYLSSDEADIAPTGPRAGRQAMRVRTRYGVRHFPPDQPTQWNVGFHLGRSLRNAEGDREQRDGGTRTTGAPLRPHIRRAHWHSYWVGPRKESNLRRLILKWMAPTGVNFTAGSDLRPTVHSIGN